MGNPNIINLVEHIRREVEREVNDRLPRKVGTFAKNHFVQDFRNGGFRNGSCTLGNPPGGRRNRTERTHDTGRPSSHLPRPGARRVLARRTHPAQGHPFWERQHPGDRWNCKCSLEQTDDPPTDAPAERDAPKAQPRLENNPGKDGRLFSQTHPYFPSSCSKCPFNSGIKNKMNYLFTNEGKNCYSCNKAYTKIKSTGGKSDMLSELKQLKELKGADFGEKLKSIGSRKEFKPIAGMQGIFSVGGENSEDYRKLIDAAKRAVSHGYTVYLMPNPKDIRTADYTFVRKGFCKMYDPKTVSGENSVGNRLKESIGQTNRVLLNMATSYNARRLAQEIKHYL